jgi:hypothetical protein
MVTVVNERHAKVVEYIMSLLRTLTIDTPRNYHFSPPTPGSYELPMEPEELLL